jgi:hypothetical protein
VYDAVPSIATSGGDDIVFHCVHSSTVLIVRMRFWELVNPNNPKTELSRRGYHTTFVVPSVRSAFAESNKGTVACNILQVGQEIASKSGLTLTSVANLVFRL